MSQEAYKVHSMKYVKDLVVPLFSNELGFTVEVVCGVVSGWTNGRVATLESIHVVVSDVIIKRYCVTALISYSKELRHVKEDIEEALKEAYTP